MADSNTGAAKDKDVSESSNWQVIAGIIIIALGIIFLFGINFGFILRKLWPLFLIAIGIYILIKPKRSVSIENHDASRTSVENGIPGMFGDIRVAGLAEGIGAIDKSLLFGDIVIDLSGSMLLEGENNVDVSVLFGDITIILPADFPLKVNLKACIGDLDYRQKHTGGFFPDIQHTDDNYASAEAKLYIKGRLFFGDIKIITFSK